MEEKNTQEGLYTPTTFQSAAGSLLRSEQRVGELLPRVLSRLDMLAIFIAIVVWVPSTVVAQIAQKAGPITYFYWVIGAVTFLLPGAVVAAQLNRFMPVDGSIYVWTHRALGPLWGFLAGFCAWFPGILLFLVGSNIVITLLQGIYAQLWGSEPVWLAAPWQQGIIVLGLFLLTGWLATFPLPFIMKAAKGIIALYVVAIFLVGLAGVVWLFKGYAPQVSFTPNTTRWNAQDLVLYGAIVLALLGIEVPLNMSAETRQPHATRLFLRWGFLIAMVAYILGTFGVMTVVPHGSSTLPYSPLIAVNMVFGTPASVLVGLLFVAFFFITTILYNVTFARILLVSALDYRLPAVLAKINRHAAPSRAIAAQTIIVLIIALFTYFIGPPLFLETGATFSAKVYSIFPAATTVIWCISMAIIFLDLPILLSRFRDLLVRNSEQLIAPIWVLHLCCIVGGTASLLSIWITLRTSWDSQLIPDTQWSLIVGLLTLVFLIIGLLGSAYPHLLSNLEAQTVAARENARLYQELRAAYTQLSELDQLKDAFIATASHELRTPLTIVQGYLELLHLMGDDNPEERQAFLSKACRACDELVVLQANIMDASLLKCNAETLRITRIPLKSVTKAIIEIFESLILKEKRAITVDIDATIFVRADEARLKQVLHNLIANALHYSPSQSPIYISAAIEEGEHMVRISVRDRGFGIPPDKQKTIFDKFVRLERDAYGSVRGSGLGLFICRQLVEAMKGTIKVESSGVNNQGSAFSFTLPLG